MKVYVLVATYVEEPLLDVLGVYANKLTAEEVKQRLDELAKNLGTTTVNQIFEEDLYFS